MKTFIICLVALAGIYLLTDMELTSVLIIAGIILFIIVMKQLLGGDKSGSSSGGSDIPDYWNWDSVYNTKTTYYDEGEITLDEAIGQFRLDYEKTMRAFREEEKLRSVADMDKDYIKSFFEKFEMSIDNPRITTLRVLGSGKYSLVQQVGSRERTYTHWPRRRHASYGYVMWKGEIRESQTSYISYGLSREDNIQYWKVSDGGSTSGFTPLRGEI